MGPKRKGEAQQQQGEKRGKAGTGSGAAGVSEVILKKLSEEGLALDKLPFKDEVSLWNDVRKECELTLAEVIELKNHLFPPSAETSSSSSSSGEI